VIVSEEEERRAALARAMVGANASTVAAAAACFVFCADSRAFGLLTLPRFCCSSSSLSLPLSLSLSLSHTHTHTHAHKNAAGPELLIPSVVALHGDAGAPRRALDAIAQGIAQISLDRTRAMLWSTKNAMLAAQNVMICAASLGMASCPMEGYDEAAVMHAIGADTERYGVPLVVAVGFADPSSPPARAPPKREELVVSMECLSQRC
jgi:nitroreductase